MKFLPPFLAVLMVVVGWTLSSADRWPRWLGVDLQLSRSRVEGCSVSLEREVAILLRWDKDGGISGHGPVNRNFGRLERRLDGTLAWGEALGSARMARAVDALRLESEYFSTLRRATRPSSERNRFILPSTDGRNWVEFLP